MLVINQLKVNIQVEVSSLSDFIIKKLKITKDDLLNYTIQKRSLDARKKNEIFFVYNLLVDVKDEKAILRKKINNVSIYTKKTKETDYSDSIIDNSKKVAIIGFGPAGMLAALTLSKNNVTVDVYERGKQVEDRIKSVDKFITERILDPNSNIQFGEGGAGTFSDGKLTSRSKDYRSIYLFDELVEAGAPEEIKYVHNPHVGTDKLIDVVKNIRQKIIGLGSSIHFNSYVSNIEKYNHGYNLTIDGKTLYYDYVILAIGHSSRDTIEMLHNNNVDITQKPFAVGFRIEHKQTLINKAQFGPNHNNHKLGAAEYKLTHQTKNEKGVYTFCMCPGGLVVPAASEEGMVVVNGMSEFKRDKVNANSALLVTVNEEDFKSNHPLAGMEFQRELERKAYQLGGSNYNAPIQTVGDFLKNKTTTKLGNVLPSYSIGITFANLRSIFSKEINEAFLEALPKMGNKLKGFDNEDALLTGVESRSSSPVRIIRDKDNMQSTNYKNLYPTGEGAGYAGGIVSAAIDGIKVAEKIIESLIIKQKS